jgi:hypothetical protein
MHSMINNIFILCLVMRLATATLFFNRLIFLRFMIHLNDDDHPKRGTKLRSLFSNHHLQPDCQTFTIVGTEGPDSSVPFFTIPSATSCLSCTTTAKAVLSIHGVHPFPSFRDTKALHPALLSLSFHIGFTLCGHRFSQWRYGNDLQSWRRHMVH